MHEKKRKRKRDERMKNHECEKKRKQTKKSQGCKLDIYVI